MVEAPKPWDWRNGLMRKYSPESAIFVGGFACAIGVGLLFAVFLLGYTFAGPPGADPRLFVAAFSGGLFVLGAFGILMGIRQHRRGGGTMPSSRSKTR